MKLPAHRAGLPGKVISFYIVPLDPAYPALAGRGTFRSNKLQILIHAHIFRIIDDGLLNLQFQDW